MTSTHSTLKTSLVPHIVKLKAWPQLLTSAHQLSVQLTSQATPASEGTQKSPLQRYPTQLQTPYMAVPIAAALAPDPHMFYPVLPNLKIKNKPMVIRCSIWECRVLRKRPCYPANHHHNAPSHHLPQSLKGAWAVSMANLAY